MENGKPFRGLGQDQEMVPGPAEEIAIRQFSYLNVFAYDAKKDEEKLPSHVESAAVRVQTPFRTYEATTDSFGMASLRIEEPPGTKVMVQVESPGLISPSLQFSTSADPEAMAEHIPLHQVGKPEVSPQELAAMGAFAVGILWFLS